MPQLPHRGDRAAERHDRSRRAEPGLRRSQAARSTRSSRGAGPTPRRTSRPTRPASGLERRRHRDRAQDRTRKRAPTSEFCNTHPGGADRFGKMTDDDLTDIATYIHTLPPVKNGPFTCVSSKRAQPKYDDARRNALVVQSGCAAVCVRSRRCVVRRRRRPAAATTARARRHERARRADAAPAATFTRDLST